MSTLEDDVIVERIERWRRNLIDTSQRNRLINFRESSSVLRLTSPAAQTIFDRLVLQKEEMEVALDAEGAENSGKLLSDRGHTVVERTLLNLRLKARAAQREQGIHILFLSIGMLKWQDSNGQSLRSPLILIPVDLRRGGPLQPYRVAALDDSGAVLNPILEHRLRTEYQLEIPSLPTDQGAASISTMLDMVQESVGQTDWTISEGIYLGLFSFAKMPMYEELTVAKDLASEHPVIRALSGCPADLPVVSGISPEQLDEKEKLSETYQVLDADSSQQEAIALAKQGASFVLQGPPGTGKSQTITNIIAESLAKGRTVLFVSEKMAALEVVKRRLDDRGLGDYCLELHSHRANRQRVVAELGRCFQPQSPPNEDLGDSEELEIVRDRLNNHVQALHELREGAGTSFFHINSELAALHDAYDLTIQFPNLHQMGIKDLEALGPLVREMERNMALLMGRDMHPWRDCLLDSWKISARPEMERSLISCRDGPAETLHLSAELGARYELDCPSTLLEINSMVEQLRFAISSPRPMTEWLENPDELLLRLKEMQDAYDNLDARMDVLKSRYGEEILSLELTEMEKRFHAEHLSPFRWLRRSYWRDMRLLRNHRTTSHKLDRKEAARDVSEALEISQQSNAVRRLEEKCAELFGSHFHDRDTDWDSLKCAIEWCKEYRDRYGAPGKALGQLIVSPSSVADSILAELEVIEQSALKVAADIDEISSSFDLTVLLSGRDVQEVGLDEISSWAKEHLDTIDRFQEWVHTNRLRRECRQHGLHELLSLAEEGQLAPEGLWDAVRKRYFSLWHDHLSTTDSRLRDFQRDKHAEVVEQFRRLDRKQLDIAAVRLRALLQKRRYSLVNDASPSLGSPMWVLRHEINRKKGLRPLRELFTRAGEAILLLKPCLLMSPLSVSMYLDPAQVHFDLVIFDEASQIRPEDAIGSIMRGRQIIIVGDTKQLPPTDFFREINEDEDVEIPDLESILDECSSCLPQKMLRWHYRSENESLIAFFNQHFYGGRLFTFPSAGRPFGRGVSFVHVPEGCYDRGASRRNMPEAVKVADLVVAHFLQHPELSLGVVAFSEAQQMAILEELEGRVRAEPELSIIFKEGIPEEFFVKNLENIQGDERDVIIFSLGYGKDSQGKMHHSFGPLNRAGGERRLNVAITRARKSLKVVSSILPQDLKSTSAGVELLKQFMEYAISGGAREALSFDEEKREGLPLENAMVKALEARGLHVHPRWGCSGYRIDLAVESHHGDLFLAVETDGPSYYSGPTARDRERLRQEVLTKLGWKVHRTWSADWVRDPDGEADRIVRAVEKAPIPTTIEEDMTPSIEIIDCTEALEDASGDVLTQAQSSVEIVPALPRVRPVPYQKVDWEQYEDLIERFRADQNAAMSEVVEVVILEESPIHPDVVHDRLRELYKKCGLQRGPTRAEEADVIGELAEQERIVSDGSFLWSPEMDAPPVRSSAEGERRELWFVCMEELRLAILNILDEENMLDEKTLVARTTALYGYKRPSTKARRRIAKAVEELIERGQLVRSQGALSRVD